MLNYAAIFDTSLNELFLLGLVLFTVIVILLAIIEQVNQDKLERKYDDLE